MSSIRERWERYIKERTGMVETNEGQQRFETRGEDPTTVGRQRGGIIAAELAAQRAIEAEERRQVAAYKASLRGDPAEEVEHRAKEQAFHQEVQKEARISAAQRNFLIEHCSRLIQRLAGEQMARGILGMEQAVAFSNAEIGAVNAQLERIKGEQANA